MKTRLISMLLVFCMLITLIPAVFASDDHITQSEAYQILMDMKEKYPEGTLWSNDYPYSVYNPYRWNGGMYKWGGRNYVGGVGCVAFTMELSDSIFGTRPSRQIWDVSIDQVRVGDILSLKNHSHFVVVAEVHDDYIVIGEANFSKNYGPRSVHWGRELSASEVRKADFMLTRYPEGPEEFNVSISGNGNGSVSISTAYAFAGDTVTISVTPDADYEVSAVYCEGMDELEVAPSGGSYSFVMPSSDVSVLVEFSKIPATPFVDIKEGKFYYDPVIWAVEKGITSGTSANTFSPDNDCTRGHVVTFLWRAAGKPEPTSTEHPFTDIKAGAYYYKAVLWAVEKGITSGKTTTTFAPDAPCSRAEVVTFLWRAAGKPAPSGSDCDFTDVKTGGFYYNAMLWAVENGITKGLTKSTFAPNAICNRGQVVTFLYRYAA